MSDSKKENEEISAEAVFIDFEHVEEVSRVFYEEAQEILEDLDDHILKLEAFAGEVEYLNVLFRKVHTIKGSVGAVPGGQLLGSLAHEFEALLGRLKKEELEVSKDCIDLFLKSSRIMKLLAQSLADKRELFPEELSEAIELIASYGTFQNASAGVPASRPLRVPTQASESRDEGVWLSSAQMNEFMRLSGELLVLKNFFQMMNQTVNFRVEPELFERRQSDFSQNLNKISDQLQAQLHTVRKETAVESFHGLQILVRQASTELNKNVHLEITGGEMLIDKTLGKDLYEALVHVARNSIDHGIEDQFERALQGKPPHGTLRLHIEEKHNVIHLHFKDDGKGLDKDRILQKALQAGLVSEAQVSSLSDDEIYAFIFNAGFSTKEKVTTMSGRGVGMDVVHSTVKKYGGLIHIENQPGQGAAFRFDIPVPQHIMVASSLLCQWSSFQLAIPLKSVAHISSCNDLQITHVDRLRFCQFSGLTVPLMSYHEVCEGHLLMDEGKVRASSAVFLKVQQSVVALLVDKIEAQTDLVIKGFGDIVKEQKGFQGISILADERVTYVLDPEKFLAMIGVSVTEKAAA